MYFFGNNFVSRLHYSFRRFVAMCGIAGLVDERLGTSDIADVGARMLEIMAHRGPDYRGTWATPPVFSVTTD
ncbi:MAG: hypothetical protein IPM83_16955 [Ignavibacteria bacterium]|nr:hypothetical protein [Ignavibacteria bacterium]